MGEKALQSLEEILQPCPREEFLSSSWGITYKHVQGWPGKFSHLLPWERLNEILEQHRLDFPRLRLTRDGQSLAPSAYLRHITGRGKPAVPRLRHAELTQQLSAGATLVLDAVDELHQPLTELAEGLELFFHERVQINAYAGWRTSHGFDLHWDDHDVFILQVTGRKRWSIHGMTRPYPIAGDSKKDKPDGEPLWEKTLQDGDLLYIPRGFWHVALPLNEPTLHLTVGVHNRTGMDLLRWATERMRGSEVFRKDLPRFATNEARAAHLSELREEFLAEWSDDVLNRYFNAMDARAAARPRLSLPWSPAEEALPSSPETRVRLLSPRPLNLEVKDGVIEFTSQKKRWRFSADALLILRRLDERRVCTVTQLSEAAKGKIDEQRVKAFLQELILNGLVAIVS
jgi:hypothetical protein